MKILGGFWGIGLLPSSLFLRSNWSFIPSSSWSSQSGKVIRDGYNFGKWIIGESIGKKHMEQHVQSGRQHYFHSGKYGMLGTTVLCVRKGPTVVIIADGQVTLGSQVVKPNVRKVRRIGDNVIGGFAGATADALTLFERLENRLEDHSGQLTRAAVELAKQWRTDKFLRRLDAVMVVADSDISLTITGNGDVLEPHDGVVGIGSGGPYAIAAARALIDLPGMDAETIALRAMKIAADNCIYTNHNFVMERISSLSDSSEDRLPSNGDSPDRCISKVKTSTSVVPTTSDVQGRKR